MTLTFELDLYRVKLNQLAKYVSERSFCTKVVVGTLRHTHTGGVLYLDHINLTVIYFSQRAQCSRCKRCISYGNSVCPSVCPSVTRRYCVKTTARSTAQFAPLDSKMCLVL